MISLIRHLLYFSTMTALGGALLLLTQLQAYCRRLNKMKNLLIHFPPFFTFPNAEQALHSTPFVTDSCLRSENGNIFFTNSK